MHLVHTPCPEHIWLHVTADSLDEEQILRLEGDTARMNRCQIGMGQEADHEVFRGHLQRLQSGDLPTVAGLGGMQLLVNFPDQSEMSQMSQY